MNTQKTVTLVVVNDNTHTKETIEIKDCDVMSVYNGKSGCMCGCNGNYSYNPLHQEAEGKNRGYAVSNDELSLKKCKAMMTRLTNMSKANLDVMYSDNGYLYHDNGSRNNVMYLNN